MDKNPEDLTDEELDRIIAGENIDEEGDGDNHDDDAQEEEQLEEEQEDLDDKSDDSEEKKDDKPADEDKKPSRREQARIRDILQKYGEPEVLKQSDKQDVKPLDYREQLDADDETLRKLEEDRKQSNEASFERGRAESSNEQVKSLQFLTRLEIDAPRVEAKYPQLDKESKDFKPEAADDINQLYLKIVGYDSKTQKVKTSDIRYSAFVDTIFNLVEDLAVQKAVESTKAIKQQAAKTGLRPDGSSAKRLNLNKAPEDMTDEELDAVIAQGLGR